MFLVQDNPGLNERLLNLLDFSTMSIEAKDPLITPIKNRGQQDQCDYSSLITALQTVGAGHEHFSAYERVCLQILKVLFSDELGAWKEQESSDDGLHRMDVVTKVKMNQESEFFATVSSYFKTKYIVFEFKNYNEKITQREVFTTEKYLYTAALRGVAVIVSREGATENALKAIKGILRESGKLILSIDNNDLITMIEKKQNGTNPSDLLADRLDDLLIELGK